MDKKKKILQILDKDKVYTKLNGSYCFIDNKEFQTQTAESGLLAWIQKLLKRSGRMYYFLIKLFGPVLTSGVFTKSCKRLLEEYSEKDVVLNIGSGPQLYSNRSDIINIDINCFDEVDITADASDLPINDDSVDCILNIAMLEHVSNPETVVKEMKRILKPGGRVIAAIPFMQPFHAAPHDYYRWTPMGLQELFSSFEWIRIKTASGPTSGMLWVVEEWLAVFLSLGNKTIHDILFVIFMIILFPVKFLDLLMEKNQLSSYCASSFFIIAQKK